MATANISPNELQEFLGVNYFAGLVSDVLPVGSPLSYYFGVSRNFAGRPTSDVPTFLYDVFDNNRTVASIGTYGTNTKRVDNRPVDQLRVAGLYSDETINFDYAQFIRNRPMGGNADVLTNNGQVYMREQITRIRQRQDNLMEWYFTRAITDGTVYFTRAEGGDGWTVSATDAGANGFTVDFGMPAKYKGQLQVASGNTDIITTNWSDPAAPILSNIREVNAAMKREFGGSLAVMVMNTTTLNYVLDNTQVKTQAGTVFTPFSQWATQGLPVMNTPDQPRPALEQVGLQVVSLRGLGFPVEIVVCDDVVDLGGEDNAATPSTGSTQLIPDDMVLFCPRPEPGTWYDRIDILSQMQVDAVGGLTEIQNYYGTATLSRPRPEPTPHLDVQNIAHYAFVKKMRNATMYADVNGVS